MKETLQSELNHLAAEMARISDELKQALEHMIKPKEGLFGDGPDRP